MIRRWINLDLNRRLLVFDPGWPDRLDKRDFRGEMQEHLLPRSSVVPELNQTWEPRLRVIRLGANEGLGDALACAATWQ